MTNVKVQKPQTKLINDTDFSTLVGTEEEFPDIVGALKRDRELL